MYKRRMSSICDSLMIKGRIVGLEFGVELGERYPTSLGNMFVVSGSHKLKIKTPAGDVANVDYCGPVSRDWLGYDVSYSRHDCSNHFDFRRETVRVLGVGSVKPYASSISFDLVDEKKAVIKKDCFAFDDRKDMVRLEDNLMALVKDYGLLLI